MTMLAGGPNTGCSFVNHEPQEKAVPKHWLLVVMDTCSNAEYEYFGQKLTECISLEFRETTLKV
jgi:hypothetical protein